MQGSALHEGVNAYAMSNDAQQNALVEACEKGDLDKIRKAVSAGADVNERGLNRRRSLAYPMDVAGNVKNGVEVLTLLIELGGDLATSDGYSTVGDAAMDGALSFGRADTVKFLRSKGIAVGPDALIGQCD